MSGSKTTSAQNTSKTTSAQNTSKTTTPLLHLYDTILADYKNNSEDYSMNGYTKIDATNVKRLHDYINAWSINAYNNTVVTKVSKLDVSMTAPINMIYLNNVQYEDNKSSIKFTLTSMSGTDPTTSPLYNNSLLKTNDPAFSNNRTTIDSTKKSTTIDISNKNDYNIIIINNTKDNIINITGGKPVLIICFYSANIIVNYINKPPISTLIYIIGGIIILIILLILFFIMKRKNNSDDDNDDEQ